MDGVMALVAGAQRESSEKASQGIRARYRRYLHRYRALKLLNDILTDADVVLVSRMESSELG